MLVRFRVVSEAATRTVTVARWNAKNTGDPRQAAKNKKTCDEDKLYQV